MKKIIFALIITLIPAFSFANPELKNCETALQKLKPSCNIIGTGMEKLRNFSEKNKTLDQSFKNVKEKIPNLKK